MVYEDFEDISNVRGTDDAIALVERMFKHQVVRSNRDRSGPNASCEGDGKAKEAFWILLDFDSQRKVFLKQCKSTSFWPRIRTLIGSPPFCFLLPGDEHVLNASGITQRRINMARTDGDNLHNTNELASGHYTDKHGRVFKVVATDRERASNTLLFRDLTAGRKIVVDMKLAKMKNAERLYISKRGSSSEKKSVVFPNVGERLRLEIQPRLKRGEEGSTVSAIVRSRKQKALNSPVVRLYCVVVVD